MGHGQSLRWIVSKWFGATHGRSIRLTRSGLGHPHAVRCVRVDATVAGREMTIFFFRGEDGCWSVSPPRGRRTVRAAD